MGKFKSAGPAFFYTTCPSPQQLVTMTGCLQQEIGFSMDCILHVECVHCVWRIICRISRDNVRGVLILMACFGLSTKGFCVEEEVNGHFNLLSIEANMSAFGHIGDGLPDRRILRHRTAGLSGAQFNDL
ncbi:unnamed protein product [Mesocestoides corti]|uniref:Uncharacterized protein n=1 Tax=Mesocestoides corti TaxID=53468 RepID=A0A0R3UD46_MESCO|nr:unnamed protein product [Mesocestoides corti]